MGRRVTYRHNADGSTTKRTTYTRKTIFGNRKSHSYSERFEAGERPSNINWWKIAKVVIVLGLLGILCEKLGII